MNALAIKNGASRHSAYDLRRPLDQHEETTYTLPASSSSTKPSAPKASSVPAKLDDAIMEVLTYPDPVLFDCLVEKHENSSR